MIDMIWDRFLEPIALIFGPFIAVNLIWLLYKLRYKVTDRIKYHD